MPMPNAMPRARGVWTHDADLDALEDSVFRDLLTFMMEDPRNISFCTRSGIQGELNHIRSILSRLGTDEAFFSIDEFGPFAVKTKPGRVLTAPILQAAREPAIETRVDVIREAARDRRFSLMLPVQVPESSTARPELKKGLPQVLRR